MTGSVYPRTTVEKKEKEENRGNRRTDISRKNIGKYEENEGKWRKWRKEILFQEENGKYHIRGMARGNWIGRMEEIDISRNRSNFSKKFALKKNTNIS